MKTPLTIGRLVEDFFLSRGGARRVPSEETELQEALRSQMSSGDTGTIFRWEDPDRERRDSTTLTATGGTDLQYGGSTIANAVPEIGRGLRAAMVLAGLGARILTGLKVNTGLPYGTTKISGEWKAEGDPASEQGDEFGKLDLQPHRVTAAVPVPRELLDIGNPVFNAWLTSELLAALAVEIERAAIAGSGIGAEPLGLLNNTAIGGVGGGPSGAAPTYGNLVDLEAAVKISAGGRFGFLVSRLVRKKLRKTFINGTGSQPVWLPTDAARLLGQPAAVSDNVPDTLVKGSSGAVCSAILAADWTEMFIGLFGPGIAIEVVQDPAFARIGKVLVIVRCYADAGFRNPACAAAMLDALCA